MFHQLLDTVHCAATTATITATSIHHHCVGRSRIGRGGSCRCAQQFDKVLRGGVEGKRVITVGVAVVAVAVVVKGRKGEGEG